MLCGVNALLDQVSRDHGDVTPRRDEDVDHRAVSVDARDQALISLLALNGLRVSEAIGANIEELGRERGHRTLVINRKGGKTVTIPLAPRTARAVDNNTKRHETSRISTRPSADVLGSRVGHDLVGGKAVSTQGSIRKDACGAWFFIIDVPAAGGRRKQVRGRGFTTKKAAAGALTELRSQLMHGTFVPTSRLSVADYLDVWLEALPASGRRPSTVAGYRHLINHDVLPAIGGLELQALTALHSIGSTPEAPAEDPVS